VTDTAIAEAQDFLNAFLNRHRSAAIPTLVGVCCLWAVEHGAADVMRGSLEAAVGLVGDLERMRSENAQ
jgi:hypothetical protein